MKKLMKLAGLALLATASLTLWAQDDSNDRANNETVTKEEKPPAPEAHSAGHFGSRRLRDWRGRYFAHLGLERTGHDGKFAGSAGRKNLDPSAGRCAGCGNDTHAVGCVDQDETEEIY